MATGTINAIQEIGTWTPTVDAGNFTSISVSNGKYIKIGKFMFASFAWTANDSASGVTYASVGGLPYTFGSANIGYGNNYNFSQGVIAPSRVSISNVFTFFSNVNANNIGVCWICGILA